MVARKLNITVLYEAQPQPKKAIVKESGKDEVYQQISEGLQKLGYSVKLLGADRDISSLITKLQKDESDLIFNVCEGIDGNNRFEPAIAALLDLLGKAYTGSNSTGLILGQDKALSKKLYAFHGLNYPKFSTIEAGQVEWADNLKFPLFVKPLGEDASVGIDGKAIVRNIKELMERISFIHTEIGSAALIEEFIDGREIYVGVLGNEKPEALPIVEWDFSQLPKGVPHIATEEAKWNEDSEAFKAPERIVDDIPEPIYSEIQKAAVVAFKALKLRDYARIDMRLRSPAKDTIEKGSHRNKRADAEEKKDLKDWAFFLIEVNPNCLLDKKAELALSAKHKGLGYPQLLDQIVKSALKRYNVII